MSNAAPRTDAPRVLAGLPMGRWIDREDIGDEHNKPPSQPCGARVSSAMALCVRNGNCYGPKGDRQPDLPSDLHPNERLARADAWNLRRAEQPIWPLVDLQAPVRPSRLPERRQPAPRPYREDDYAAGPSAGALAATAGADARPPRSARGCRLS